MLHSVFDDLPPSFESYLRILSWTLMIAQSHPADSIWNFLSYWQWKIEDFPVTSPLISDITIKKNTHSICFTPPIVPGTESDPPAPERAPWTPAATLQPWRSARAPGLGPWKATGPGRWWNPGGWRILGWCWKFVWGIQMFFFWKWGKYSIAP